MEYIEKLVQKQMDIASQLFDLLNKQGINQRELAKKSGVDEPTISEIVRGLANPTLETLAKLESALNDELIVAPKFFKRDLVKEGYTIITPSISNKLELDFEDLFERTFFPRKGDKSEIKEIEFPGISESQLEISNNKSKKYPEAA